MSHSFANCPLRSSCLFITNHSTQSIITATDELLDLLGYSMTDIVGRSIVQFIKLSSKLTIIPECAIQHSNGQLLSFQVCIHQDPLGSSTCLDYWLMKPMTEPSQNKLLIPSIIKLSPFGTIDQVQNQHLAQPNHALLGRPIMTFIYNDDVPILCSHLSNLYKRSQEKNEPICLRWSKSESMSNYEESLNYDWMSFTLLSSYNRPLCLIRPLQCESCQSTNEMVIIQNGLLYDVLIYIHQWFESTKVYMKEYLQYVLSYLLNQDTLIGYFIKSNSITKRSIGLLEFIGLILDQ